MPTRFAELEQRVSDAVDDHHGENTVVIPTIDGEFAANSADPENPSYEMIGVADFNPLTVQVQDKSTYDGFVPNLSGDSVHISFDITKFGEGDDEKPRPKKKWLIQLTDRPKQPKFRIAKDPDDDGLGRILCVCVPSK